MNVRIWTIAVVLFSFGDFVQVQVSGCDNSEWTCNNGDCIPKHQRCNGKADCGDGSDETVKECISSKCSDRNFRCVYGACVNRARECNGQQDCVDNSDELTRKCLPNIDATLRGKCGPEKFQCRSGECISTDNLCDGSVECSDRSDETVQVCASKCCPPYGFRCGYGGCISKKLRCNGRRDCADGSDEVESLCRNMPTTFVFPPSDADDAPRGACRVTRIPKNGWIEYVKPPHATLSIGEFVSNVEQVNYKCMDNHLIKGPTRNLCVNGAWQQEVPDCKPFCSTKVITGVTFVANNCRLNNTVVRCTEPAAPGTIAHINCRDRYETRLPVEKRRTTCGSDGVWSPAPERCDPICGEEPSSGTPYIVGGRKGRITEVPWHVAIYKFDGTKYELHCGGTIINERVIISAMHCFWDVSEDRPFEESGFRVVAGKEKLAKNAEESLATQEFEIEDIFYDEGYNDATGNYAADIVMILLKTTIEFKPHIAPICIPYGLPFDERVVPDGWQGRVAGWGLTASGGSQSETLKIVELPSISRRRCISESDITFKAQITHDKFCAGHLDMQVAVCHGDSGGGLVFPTTQADGRKVYHLRGIVSTGANKQSSCDADKYTTFTNILNYEQLIEAYDTPYRPK